MVIAVDNVLISCKSYLMAKLKFNILSCSKLGDYGVTLAFEKRRSTLTDHRQNGELFAYIRKRKANGLFAAKLRVSHTGET